MKKKKIKLKNYYEVKFVQLHIKSTQAAKTYFFIKSKENIDNFSVALSCTSTFIIHCLMLLKNYLYIYPII